MFIIHHLTTICIGGACTAATKITWKSQWLLKFPGIRNAHTHADNMKNYYDLILQLSGPNCVLVNCAKL